MNVDQFDYHLPPDLIAQTPLEPRHSARLMVVDRAAGTISHHNFTDLVDLLRSGDILVANDSRVIPARLYGHKQSGGKVEILLLKEVDPLHWEVLVGGKRLRPGVQVLIDDLPPETRQNKAEKDKDSLGSQRPGPPITLVIKENLGEARRLVQFNQPLRPHLATVGHTPLPPYIHTPPPDTERYQTVFSRIDGSTAAPTAGLHFTPEILLALRNKGIALDYVTLHIGLDTFKPVVVEQVELHAIHQEFSRLSSETAHRINQAILGGGRLVAVGTTSVRTLETAALRSAGMAGSLRNASMADLDVCPWRPVAAIEEETDLFIYPGFNYRAVDCMITNFHLPRSTLLMLVSAFAGLDLMQQAYQVAIEEAYRFYSFGDAMLII